MGDIGNHFPPSDIKWKNKPSIFFMEYTRNLLTENKFRINNLDITLICEKPKVSKYKNEFIKSVSKALELDQKLINIKGTTTEKAWISWKRRRYCMSSFSNHLKK